MKRAIVTALVCMSAAAIRADIIMDATNLNGAFDTSATGSGARTFDQTPNWYNIGTGNQTATAVNDTLSAAPASGWNAVISDNGLGGAVVHSVNTGYTLQLGDYFNISYDWRDAAGWEANDQVRVAVAAYDNDNAVTGTEIWREWVLDKVTTAATWESVSGQTAAVSASAAGRTLFIQTYGINGGLGSGDFARVDNIVVAVVPEPGTLALFSLGLVVLAVIRKRG
ncbi:MAG: PEP-CTERM sorting domain-containing protein [Verrucomicrobia bacterium]|nr:PEP-CTERM sorting domain-containing protein [Kiritimatiellia bacterium]MCP5488141.1 PEP-CTERM sorting domain-containing protein [Verrucomicrobiota bacterium]